MKVKFIADKLSEEFKKLTSGNIYRVVSIEADNYRIINNYGAPVLYPPEAFEIIEEGGEKWITEYVAGKRYSSPPELKSRDFWERFARGDLRTNQTLRYYLAEL